MTQPARLTQRGVSMLIMRGEGRTNKEIGALYGISEDFARTTIRRTVLALGANDVAHALAILLVTDPGLLGHLRQELTIPDKVRRALYELAAEESQ